MITNRTHRTYTLEIVGQKYMKIDGEYRSVDVPIKLEYNSFDLLMSTIRNLINGKIGHSINFGVTVTECTEEDDDE